jgi:HK97 family phage prohead protease
MTGCSYLSGPLAIKSIDERGAFVGFASFYGNEDLDGDVVDRGAFTKTIQERPITKILFNHNPNLPIGKGRLEDSAFGLVLHGQLNLDLPSGRDVYSNLKAGVLDALSIGYDVVKAIREGGARHLKELRLWEVSVVTFPANPSAVVTDVKGQTAEQIRLLAQLRDMTRRMQDDVDSIHAWQLAGGTIKGARDIARLAGTTR